MKIKFINLQRVHVCTSFMILAGYKIVEHIDELVEKKQQRIKKPVCVDHSFSFDISMGKLNCWFFNITHFDDNRTEKYGKLVGKRYFYVHFTFF